MRKFITILALGLLLAGLCACTKEPGEGEGFEVYYTNETKDQLTEQGYVPAKQGGEELIRELLHVMKNPQVLMVQSAIPKAVEVSTLQLQDGHLYLDFNSPYREMDNVEEVLLRAAVVKTLLQVPEVEDIRFTVEGKALYDISGIEIGAMDEDTFIDTKGEGINSYQYASLTLYFSDDSGEKLVKEMRNVHYSSNNSLEKVVVEQLLSGPANSELSPILFEETKILSVAIEGNTCILNFDRAFNQAPVDSPATPQTSIYGLVNTICEVCNVSRVEIQIDGSSEAVYREEIGLDQKFKRKSELIETVEETEPATESGQEVLDPEVGVESLINRKAQETENTPETSSETESISETQTGTQSRTSPVQSSEEKQETGAESET